MKKHEILKLRLKKVESHYSALRDYKELIDEMVKDHDIFLPAEFINLKPERRAILDAYLKRFSSIQDFLGAKIFPLILSIAGVTVVKMSEVLSEIEREQIIDSLENWIELREVRNDLEHDYPDELEDALEDLKFCIASFNKIEQYYLNSIVFAERYLK